MRVLILAVVLLGCSVNRKSEQYACGSNGDCKDGRLCDRGFCVESECPSPCTSCDNVAMTCEVDCTGRTCGTVRCPDNYSCTINCVGNSACSSVHCSEGTTCAITCAGNNACRSVDCSTGACSVTCAINSCGDVDCSNSCKCDVACNGPNSCKTTTCPAPGGTLCTQNGSSDTPCSSSFAPTCSSC